MAGYITLGCHHGTGDDDASDITISIAFMFAISAIAIGQSGIPGPFIQQCSIHIDDGGAVITCPPSAVMIVSGIFCIMIASSIPFGISPVLSGFPAGIALAFVVTAGLMAFG